MEVETFPKENNFAFKDLQTWVVWKETTLCWFRGLPILIFLPKTNLEKNNLPVMFWIHGGGNTSGLKDLYDFSKMASKHDVIVVRINYRLVLLVGLPIRQSGFSRWRR